MKAICAPIPILTFLSPSLSHDRRPLPAGISHFHYFLFHMKPSALFREKPERPLRFIVLFFLPQVPPQAFSCHSSAARLRNSSYIPFTDSPLFPRPMVGMRPPPFTMMILVMRTIRFLRKPYAVQRSRYHPPPSPFAQSKHCAHKIEAVQISRRVAAAPPSTPFLLAAELRSALSGHLLPP